MSWNPSDSFFEKQSAEEVTWQIKQYTAIDFPVKLFECKIQGFELEATGFAVDSDANFSMKKAFAEAWERLIFLKQNKSDKLISNTNGFAAGATNEMAMQNAKEELIERALLNLAWQTQTGWRKTNFKGLKNKYIQFALILKGWRLRIYDLHSTEGHVKSIFATHSENGLIFDSTFNSNEKQSEQKLLFSILKNISLPKLEPLSDLPDVAKPLDHAKFYTDPKNLNALKFLDTDQTSDKIFTLENPNLLETTILNKAGTFPAVAYCQHPTWPKISWGSSSIKGKNLWPHPLA